MKNIILRPIFLALSILCGATLYGQVQEEKSPEEVAYEEAMRLEEMLKLEPHQAFYVDSILQHDMRALYDEIMTLRASGTQDYRVYQQIREKWTAQMDSAFHKVFNPEQWLEYQKYTGKLAKEKAEKRKKEKQEKKEKRKK